jgi:hypothetical protein
MNENSHSPKTSNLTFKKAEIPTLNLKKLNNEDEI